MPTKQKEKNVNSKKNINQQIPKESEKAKTAEKDRQAKRKAAHDDLRKRREIVQKKQAVVVDCNKKLAELQADIDGARKEIAMCESQTKKAVADKSSDALRQVEEWNHKKDFHEKRLLVLLDREKKIRSELAKTSQALDAAKYAAYKQRLARWEVLDGQIKTLSSRLMEIWKQTIFYKMYEAVMSQVYGGNLSEKSMQEQLDAARKNDRVITEQDRMPTAQTLSKVHEIIQNHTLTDRDKILQLAELCGKSHNTIAVPISDKEILHLEYTPSLLNPKHGRVELSVREMERSSDDEIKLGTKQKKIELEFNRKLDGVKEYTKSFIDNTILQQTPPKMSPEEKTAFQQIEKDGHANLHIGMPFAELHDAIRKEREAAIEEAMGWDPQKDRAERKERQREDKEKKQEESEKRSTSKSQQTQEQAYTQKREQEMKQPEHMQEEVKSQQKESVQKEQEKSVIFEGNSKETSSVGIEQRAQELKRKIKETNPETIDKKGMIKVKQWSDVEDRILNETVGSISILHKGKPTPVMVDLPEQKVLVKEKELKNGEKKDVPIVCTSDALNRMVMELNKEKSLQQEQSQSQSQETLPTIEDALEQAANKTNPYITNVPEQNQDVIQDKKHVAENLSNQSALNKENADFSKDEPARETHPYQKEVHQEQGETTQNTEQVEAQNTKVVENEYAQETAQDHDNPELKVAAQKLQEPVPQQEGDIATQAVKPVVPERGNIQKLALQQEVTNARYEYIEQHHINGKEKADFLRNGDAEKPTIISFEEMQNKIAEGHAITVNGDNIEIEQSNAEWSGSARKNDYNAKYLRDPETGAKLTHENGEPWKSSEIKQDFGAKTFNEVIKASKDWNIEHGYLAQSKEEVEKNTEKSQQYRQRELDNKKELQSQGARAPQPVDILKSENCADGSIFSQDNDERQYSNDEERNLAKHNMRYKEDSEDRTTYPVPAFVGITVNTRNEEAEYEEPGATVAENIQGAEEVER